MLKTEAIALACRKIKDMTLEERWEKIHRAEEEYGPHFDFKGVDTVTEMNEELVDFLVYFAWHVCQEHFSDLDHGSKEE